MAKTRRIAMVLAMIMMVLSLSALSYAQPRTATDATHTVKAYMPIFGWIPIPGGHGDKAFNGARLNSPNQLKVYVKEAQYSGKTGNVCYLKISGVQGVPYDTDNNGKPDYYLFNYPSQFNMNQKHKSYVNIQFSDGTQHGEKACYLKFFAK